MSEEAIFFAGNQILILTSRQQNVCLNDSVYTFLLYINTHTDGYRYIDMYISVYIFIFIYVIYYIYVCIYIHACVTV